MTDAPTTPPPVPAASGPSAPSADSEPEGKRKFPSAFTVLTTVTV